MTTEPSILSDVANRFVLFPIKYNQIWSMYKKAESAFWTAEEIDLSKDLNDWEQRMSENERSFVKNVLAFFAGSDGIVNENLSVRFMNDVKPPEAKAFYGFQIAMENIHCVKGDTLILTDQGYREIATMENEYIKVWNGEQFSEVKVVQTSLSAAMVHVTLSNGMSLVCTPEHNWLMAEPAGKRVPTSELQPGDALLPFHYPKLDVPSDPEIFSNAYTHGFMCLDASGSPPDSPRLNKHFVPVNYSKATKIAWLSGVLRHATINPSDNKAFCSLFSYYNAFIAQLQLLLTTLDVHAIVQLADAQPSCLTLTREEAAKLVQAGVSLNMDANALALLSNAVVSTEQKLTVAAVHPMQTKMPSYCFEEPLRGMGVFNGILTGQSETYSLLIDTYVKDPTEKARLLNAIDTIPCIKRKAQWALKWIEDKNASFAMRLVAFACVEGIFFSGAFCAIFWLKERGIMPGLCFSNELISRDESLHTEFAVLLHSMLGDQRLSAELVREIVSEAVDIETEFITESIPCSLLGMNADLMTQYIKFVADRLVVQLGYEKIYQVTNPFHFMDRICLDTKTNFFENREGNYSKANVGSHAAGDAQQAFVFSKDEDF